MAIDESVKFEWGKFLNLKHEELDSFVAHHRLAFLPGEAAVVQKEMKKELPYWKNKGIEINSDFAQMFLKMVDQQWCEHSAHGTSKGRIKLLDYSLGNGVEPIITQYKNLIKETIFHASEFLNKDFVASMFKDDAGIIYMGVFEGSKVGFDHKKFVKLGLAYKCETHNFPFKIYAIGGTETALGGDIRDILAVLGDLRGATYVLCLPPPDLDLKKVPKGVHLPIQYLLDGVKGNESYGNKFGVPTVISKIDANRIFATNPLCFSGAFGVVDIDEYLKAQRIMPGDKLVAWGGATGRDGLEGATMASMGGHVIGKGALTETEKKQAKRLSGAVQIGNPVVQQAWAYVLNRFIFPMSIITKQRDTGGGGYNASCFELFEMSNGGVLYLDRIWTKEKGLTDLELILSESQERQTATVRPQHAKTLVETMEYFGVPAAVLGTCTGDGRIRLTKNNGKTVVFDANVNFLRNGKPKVRRTAIYKELQLPEPIIKRKKDLTEDFLKVLAYPTIGSNEMVMARKFDHHVGNATVHGPLSGPHYDAPNDAAVIQPFMDYYKGAVISIAINSRRGIKSVRNMVKSMFDEGIMRNIVAGGNPHHMATGDNWSFANIKRDDEELGRMAVGYQTFADMVVLFEAPGIVGKDSSNNNHVEDGEKYYIPTMLHFSAMSVIDDVRKTLTSFAKNPGNLIYLVGSPTKAELGGSVFYAIQHFKRKGKDEFAGGKSEYHVDGYIGNKVPELDEQLAKRTYHDLHHIVQNCVNADPKESIIRSSKIIAAGGLVTALALMAYGGRHGMQITLCDKDFSSLENHELLFSETLTRALFEVDAHRHKEFENMMNRTHIPYNLIGLTDSTQDFKVVCPDLTPAVSTTLDKIGKAWKSAYNFAELP
ncbi:MAG: AIR synthase-related protein [Candidatus Woesearchaeota archaeon]|nr:AIR synthase-related protein [Candidatus Woesearchaeota archaeon]